MARRVFVHVGAPKTGTTYLQSTVARNRSLLAERGLLYPATTQGGDHFDAAIDLIEHRWGGRLEAARGGWDKLAAAAERTTDDVLISHEVLAAATPAQVERAQASLAGAELHVVYTARDLGRQIPAEWQETVKHRGRLSFDRFLAQVVAGRRTNPNDWFWRVQGLPSVLGRWSAGLPPERVHLITVPPPGSPPDVLWSRFATTLGIAADLELEPPEHANASLGTAETAMLRRLNIVLKGRAIPQQVYAGTVRDLVARDVLGRRRDTVRTTLPPRLRGFVDEVTEEWLEWAQGAGVDVVGDLDELRTLWPADDASWDDPDAPPPSDVLDSAIQAVAALVEQDAARFRAARATTRRGIRRRLGR